MKKTIYILVILVILVVIAVLIAGANNNSNGNITNGEMLKNDNETKIVTEMDVSYFETAKGYYARPEKEGSYPGVILIHENRGLRPEIKGMADQLAKEGYLVLAVDLLGEVVETQDQARALTAKYDQKKGIDNMKAAVEFLKSKGSTKVASLGWCFGGAQSLQLALSGQQMDATLIYYGRLATSTTVLAPIKWPVLGVFGGADQSIATSTVNQFDEALDVIGVEHEIYIYPGVGHAFANPSGMNYAPEETKDAWAKTVAFLAKHLK